MFEVTMNNGRTVFLIAACDLLGVVTDCIACGDSFSVRGA